VDEPERHRGPVAGWRPLAGLRSPEGPGRRSPGPEPVHNDANDAGRHGRRLLGPPDSRDAGLGLQLRLARRAARAQSARPLVPQQQRPELRRGEARRPPGSPAHHPPAAEEEEPPRGGGRASGLRQVIDIRQVRLLLE
jgi:hypothetical protein